jgi:CRISPR-associated protein Csm2
MTSLPNKPIRSPQNNSSSSPNQAKKETKPNSSQLESQEKIDKQIINTINNLEGGLKAYPIRTLIKQAEKFGFYLKEANLKTHQIRKFLNAVNQLKFKLAQKKEFSVIKDEVIYLTIKLVYAAAKNKEAADLSKVIIVAIEKVESAEDFYRLVQLIESIIAYHKAAGGKE